MTPVFIYALRDPVTGIVRYCGQTVDPDDRLSAHIKDSRKEKWRCANWISSLLSKNLKPVMEILDVVPDTEVDFWEREYIQNFRERGIPLTNILPGGKSCRGDNHPCFGTKASPKKLEAQSRAVYGKKHSRNTSGFVGVTWHAACKKWQASFGVSKLQGVTRHVGLFLKLEDAVFVRALAMDKYFTL